MATSRVLFQEGRERVRESGSRGDDRKLVLRLFFCGCVEDLTAGCFGMEGA